MVDTIGDGDDDDVDEDMWDYRKLFFLFFCLIFGRFLEMHAPQSP